MEQGKIAELASRIDSLVEEYPFRGRGILPAEPTQSRIDLGRQLDKKYCAACHDVPYLQTERPAFNLFDQAVRVGMLEFAARMVVGIRGESLTGLDNPFNVEELAALIAYYRNGREPKNGPTGAFRLDPIDGRERW